MDIKISKYCIELKDYLDQLDYDFDTEGSRPAWIHIKNPDFKARFISITTTSDSEILYKRFTGNFYYPVDLVQKNNEEKRFYDKYAQFYDHNTAKNNLPMAQFLLDKMLSAKIPKNAKILDAGSGSGIFSDLASRNGFANLTLLDIYDSMLNIAKIKPSLKAAKFITGDVTDIQLTDNYDVLVSVMMFDALDERRLNIALRNLTSHLIKGAHVFIVEDKDRKAYSEFFTIIESGLFDVSKEKSFQKFYLIGIKAC